MKHGVQRKADSLPETDLLGSNDTASRRLSKAATTLATTVILRFVVTDPMSRPGDYRLTSGIERIPPQADCSV